MNIEQELRAELDSKIKVNPNNLSILFSNGTFKIWIYQYVGNYSWVLDIPDFFDPVAERLNTNDVILLLYKQCSYGINHTAALLVNKKGDTIEISEYRNLAQNRLNQENKTLAIPFNLIDVKTGKPLELGYAANIYNNTTEAISNAASSVRSAVNNTLEYFSSKSNNDTKEDANKPQ